MNQQNKIKYFLYARKSTESEDRQVQSIEDQINRLKQLAQEQGLSIQKIYTEAKSAKKPNNRPLFDEMIGRIEAGDAQGILCWQINRLTRNPIDSGKISWLLQQNILKSIHTPEREYLPEDNVLLFNVESGMANQFILDLSKNVKRGIRSKLEKGWRPGMAALGYLNERTDHTIIADPERFPLLRKAWDLMLTGNYTIPQIHSKLNNEWGFRTPKRKRTGNKLLALSGLYKIFTNLFYTRIIVHNGVQYEGKHEPMITLEEFDRVQMILGRKGKPRPKKHHFAFTGLIRCGECGCMNTAETKRKIIKSTGEVKEYTYYHCTRKRLDYKCSERTGLRQEDLEAQIEEELQKFTILPEFKDWALEVLNENNDKEIEERTKIHESRNKALLDTQRQLDNLTKMRYRELISDEEFTKERNLLQTQTIQMRERLRETESRADQWLELTEKTFNFALQAREAFITGDLETKRSILTALGQNPILKNGKLIITPNEWLQPIANGYKALEEEYLGLEPANFALSGVKSTASAGLITRWQGR